MCCCTMQFDEKSQIKEKFIFHDSIPVGYSGLDYEKIVLDPFDPMDRLCGSCGVFAASSNQYF